MKKKLTLLFFISVIYMFGYELILIKRPASYECLHDFGKVFNQLIIGYNASYIFYLLIELHDREQNNKKLKIHTTYFLNSILDNMIKPIEYIFTDIIDNRGSLRNLCDYDFYTVCNKIDLHKDSNVTKTTSAGVQPLTLCEYFHMLTEDVKNNCQKVLETIIIIDDEESELIDIINSIMYSGYHDSIEICYKAYICKAKTAKFPAVIDGEVYFDYYKKIFELNDALSKKGFEIRNSMLHN